MSVQSTYSINQIDSDTKKGKESVYWDDLKAPFTRVRQGATQKPDFDFTENGLLFPQNDTAEIAYTTMQFPHAYKEGSNIKPHIHWIQSTSTVVTWIIQYRWYNNGTAVPSSWTMLSTSTPVFTYTSGNLLQISSFSEIDGTGMKLSSIMDLRIWRDDNTTTGDVLGKEFDIHYQIDRFGSEQEFIKEA